jgi:hypothetical protein
VSTITFVGFNITKADKQPDGSVIVWGPCTTDDVDSDRQVIDADFAAKGLAEWLKSGANIRQMHQPIAVGKGVELVREGNAHWLKSRVVDTNAVNLVTNGVLQAYSVGISNARIVKDASAPGGRIVGGTFVEVSLVDRPANAACKVDLVEKGEKGEAIWTAIVSGDVNKTWAKWDEEHGGTGHTAASQAERIASSTRQMAYTKNHTTYMDQKNEATYQHTKLAYYHETMANRSKTPGESAQHKAAEDAHRAAITAISNTKWAGTDSARQSKLDAVKASEDAALASYGATRGFGHTPEKSSTKSVTADMTKTWAKWDAEHRGNGHDITANAKDVFEKVRQMKSEDTPGRKMTQSRTLANEHDAMSQYHSDMRKMSAKTTVRATSHRIAAQFHADAAAKLKDYAENTTSAEKLNAAYDASKLASEQSGIAQRWTEEDMTPKPRFKSVKSVSADVKKTWAKWDAERQSTASTSRDKAQQISTDAQEASAKVGLRATADAADKIATDHRLMTQYHRTEVPKAHASTRFDDSARHALAAAKHTAAYQHWRQIATKSTGASLSQDLDRGRQLSADAANETRHAYNTTSNRTANANKYQSLSQQILKSVDAVITKTFDPNVGGGVTRDKIPAKTFAGKNRSFPIVTPGDVSDAASSIGRAGDDNYSSDKLKANIIRIANRKGKEFVAQLPDSWKENSDDATKAVATTATVKKGKVPKADRKVTNAIEEADDAIENAKDAQDEDNKAHMETKEGDDKDMTDTDGDTSSATKSYSSDYATKRLHDALCMAYTQDAVLKAHKTINTLADAIDIDYWKHQAEKAFGEGPDAAMPVLNAYAAANRLASLDADLISQAHERMHKAFADMYPNVHLSPTAISAGMFKRPFISAGRAGLSPNGKPNLPIGTKVPSASDFNRPLITEGHEAASPMHQEMGATKSEEIDITGATFVKITHERTGYAVAGPSEKVAYKQLRTDLLAKGVQLMTWKQRQFYTNNAKDQATSAMQQLHDYICMNHPDICQMMPPGTTHTVDDAVPANDNASMMNNNQDAHPMPASMPTTKTVKATTNADIAKAIAKATRKMDKRAEKLAKKLAAAHKRIESLEKSADTSEPVYRGPRVIPFVPKAMTTTKAEEDAARLKVEKSEEVAWLRKEVTTGDPEARRNAVEKLQSMLTPDELAQVLTK